MLVGHFDNAKRQNCCVKSKQNLLHIFTKRDVGFIHVSNRLSVNIGIIYKHASYFSQNSALPPQALLSVEIVSLTPASDCPRTGKFIHPCQLHPQASREAKTLQGYDTPT